MSNSLEILTANFDPKPESCLIFARFLVKTYFFKAKQQPSLNLVMPNITTICFWCLALFMAACGSMDEEAARRAAAGSAKLAPDGLTVFRQKCVTCHGADGTLGLNGAKDLSKSMLPVEERVNIITHGKNLMTPFDAVLSPEEIQAVANYTLTLKK